MNINLHIERLILDGIDVGAGEGPLLQTIIAGELARLLAEKGLSPGLAQGAAVPKLSGKHLRFRESNRPAQLGRQIAQSVYGGIGHE